MNGLSEDVNDFLVQAYEDLEEIDVNLVELEKNPNDNSLVDALFRCLHSIKGCSGFVEFSILGNIAHAGENLLGQIRDGRIQVDSEIISALLDVGDIIREILSKIESTGNEGDDNYEAILGKLQNLQQNKKSSSETKQRMGDILLSSGTIQESDITEAINEQNKGDPRYLGEILVDKNSVEPSEVLKALERQNDQTSVVSQNIRVDVAVLDNLMSLVGELVLTRNQIMSQVSKSKATHLVAASDRLNAVTKEIQDCMIKTRLQPIGKVWSKFPRVVRDMALKCGKNIEVKLEGEDTLLDKSLIEAINEPLIHLVRNSVDHGIELPAERESKGKPVQGQISLRSYHENGNVHIEISDNGAGIDASKTKQKAIDKGLITEADAESLSEQESLNLIFIPGFSTADQVTDISGRGVGMDVVKTNLEKIGGSIRIDSEIGKGITTVLTVPLSVAKIPALIVLTSGERFVIPEISVAETIQLTGDQARQTVDLFQQDQVYQLRDETLPVIDLARELMIKSNDNYENEDLEVALVIMHAEGRKFALLVDSVSDVEDIVIKSSDESSNRLLIFSGDTFTSDGRGALILDAIGLSQAYLKDR